MNGQVVVKDDPASRIVVDLAPGTVRWATTTWVPEALLRACSAARDAQGRAPLGDSGGAWQKVGEFVTADIMAAMPFEAFGQDVAATRRFVNDPDRRAFRCDGAHRVF